MAEVRKFNFGLDTSYSVDCKGCGMCVTFQIGVKAWDKYNLTMQNVSKRMRL